MTISTRAPFDPHSGTFRTPWFQVLESPRLSMIPVQDRNGLGQAFSLIADQEVAQLMEFPPNLSLRQFERGFHQAPRKDIFLLHEKVSGSLAGLVIFCAIPGRPGWHSIMYGLRKDFRGLGLAREGCRALLACMAQDRISEGISAIVKRSNRPSLKVVEALGLRVVAGSGLTEWAMPRENYRPTLAEWLWRLPHWERLPATLERVARRVMAVLI